jgi:hypothetical protein
MSLIGICNVDRLEQLLNTCVVKLENATSDNEQLLIDIIKMIDSLAAYDISLLCKPKVFSHKLFIKFRDCYNMQLNIWREKLDLGRYAQEILSKIGKLFIALSERISDIDLIKFEEFLFEKTVVKELCLCLKNVIYRIDDPNIAHVGNLIFAFGCFNYNGRNLQNYSLQEELLDDINECLKCPWYEVCLRGEMTAEQKTIFDTCLDYILNSADEHRKRCCDTISTDLIKTFPRWFHEQVINTSVFNWSEQIVFIISKLISILTNQIWEFHNTIDQIHIDSYKLLIESLLLILSKTSIKCNQNDKNKFDITIGIYLRNLADLALDPHLLNKIERTNFSQLYPYMTQNERPDIQIDACHLLLTTLSKTELPSLIDTNKLISTVLKSFISDNETFKRRHHFIATMIHLQRKLLTNSPFDLNTS